MQWLQFEIHASYLSYNPNVSQGLIAFSYLKLKFLDVFCFLEPTAQQFFPSMSCTIIGS